MKREPNLYQKSLVGFLYIVQGIFLALPSTSTLTYKKIPPYSILGVFSMALIPFSLKFISAPIIQKYTIPTYGRRKTWLIISQILACILLLISSNFTGQQEHTQKLFAFLLLCVVFMISLQDICTDALAVKQLNSVTLASYMQCMFQPIGWIMGSLFYLQLVSGSLPTYIGLKTPVLTVQQFFIMLSVFTIIASIVIHFTYKETVTKQQQEDDTHLSLWQVIKLYKYFLNIKYKSCRQAIQLLIYMHGLIYFKASYSVELIKANIVSKDLLTTFENAMIIIPIFFLNDIMKKYFSDIDKVHKYIRVLLTLRLCIMALLFFSQSQSKIFNLTFLGILYLLSSSQFFLTSIICNNFIQSKYSGMFVTMTASFNNFGANSAIQMEVISYVGYRSATIFGFIYTIFIILIFGKLAQWIRRGKDIQTAKMKIQQKAQ